MEVVKLLKKIVAIFILLNIFLISTNCYASNPIDQMITAADNFAKEPTSNTVQTFDGESLKNMSGYIYNTLLGIGVFLAIAVGGFLGIQFMICSVEEKAKYKEALVGYVVGCCVIFGAFGIWRILVKLLGGI